MTEADDGLTLFEVVTPLGFTVHCTRAWWNHVTTVKHPAMAGKADAVVQTLREPAEIRRSRHDAEIFLFYRSERVRRWVCVVARREGSAGFLVTAYPTDAIKEGDRIWPG